MASGGCVLTSHLKNRRTIRSGEKIGEREPVLLDRLDSSRRSRCAGGVAPMPRRADGQPPGACRSGREAPS